MYKFKGFLLNKPLLFFCLFFLSFGYIQAQSLLTSLTSGETSVYAGSGVSKLYGDIGGYTLEKSILADINSSFVVGLRHTTLHRFGYSFLLDYNNHFESTDADTHLSSRNMSFKSVQLGLNAQIEYTFIGGKYYENSKPHSLYALFGAGVAFSNAQIHDENMLKPTDKVKLKEQALGISGGLGYQYRISNSIGVGAEYRLTQFLSDYMDGFHPLNSRKLDMSMDLRISLSYFFKVESGGGSSK